MADTTITQEEYFAKIPKAVVYHPELSGNDVRVYATISERGGSARHSWPGVRRIAKDIGVSTATVQNALERLEEFKLIEVERQKGRVNHYHLPLIPTVSEFDTPPYQNSAHTVSESDTELEPLTRTTERAAASPAEIPAVYWARQWAQQRGVAFTPHVRRKWSKQVQEFINAEGIPSDELLKVALNEEILEPVGWAYIAGKVKPAIEYEDCADCANRRFIYFDEDGEQVEWDSPDAETAEHCPTCSVGVE